MKLILFICHKLKKILFSILTIFKGKNYYCPCCNKYTYSFKKFKLIVEDGPRGHDIHRFENVEQKVLCPYCNSYPRHRILASWAEKNLDILRNSKILYFAPEKSMMRWMKRNHIVITTADLYKKADLKLDITHIDLPDNSYDMVFCLHVLEHVSDYKRALTELHRILTNNGLLIIAFPIDETYNTVYEEPAGTYSERIKKFGQGDHLRIFGRDSLDLLASYGFSVSIINLEQMPDNIMPIVAPSNYDSNKIFLCQKV